MTAALALMLSLAVAGQQPAAKVDSDRPLDPGEIDFRLEVVTPSPLPYQPVRVRATVRNIGKRNLRPYSADLITRASLKGPGDDEFRKVDAALTFFPRDRISAPTNRETMNRLAPLLLAPGEETSAVFALAVEWPSPRKDAASDGAKALFPRPGDYTLKLVYQSSGLGDGYAQIESTVNIRIGEPRGDDKEVIAKLKDDPVLVEAVLNSVDPPDAKGYESMLALLKQYPKSTYAAYFHFAAARYLSAAGGGEWRLNAARAATHLSRVPARGWAYAPNAMILMREVCLPRELDHYDWFLREAYADTVEWLEEAAASCSEEQWRAFRKWKTDPERTRPPAGPVLEKSKSPSEKPRR